MATLSLSSCEGTATPKEHNKTTSGDTDLSNFTLNILSHNSGVMRLDSMTEDLNLESPLSVSPFGGRFLLNS